MLPARPRPGVDPPSSGSHGTVHELEYRPCAGGASPGSNSCGVVGMVKMGTNTIRSSVTRAELTEVVEHLFSASIRVGHEQCRSLVLLLIYRD